MHIVDIDAPVIVVDTEHIDIIEHLRYNDAFGTITLDKLILLLELLRLFEFQLLGTRIHLAFQVIHQLACLAVEYLFHAFDISRIFLLRHHTFAASLTPFQMVFEAETPLAAGDIFRCYLMPACAQRIELSY